VESADNRAVQRLYNRQRGSRRFGVPRACSAVRRSLPFQKRDSNFLSRLFRGIRLLLFVLLLGNVRLRFSAERRFILASYSSEFGRLLRLAVGFLPSYRQYASEKFKLNFLSSSRCFGARRSIRATTCSQVIVVAGGYTQARVAPVLQFASLLEFTGFRFSWSRKRGVCVLWLYIKRNTSKKTAPLIARRF
jgi:hypothetical protein